MKENNRKKNRASYFCLSCCKKFPSQFTRTLHMQKKHLKPKSKVLIKCKEEFSYDDELKIPKLEEYYLPESNIKVESNEDLQCFTSVSRCLTDVKVERDVSETVVCKIEVEETKIQESSEQIERKFNKRSLVECKLCFKQIQRCFLKKHIVSIHKPSMCCLCKENIFSSKHAFKPSIKSNILHYKCCCCSKIFILMSLLRKHLFTHVNDNCCSCIICERRFVSEKHFREHLKEHNDVIYTCMICGTNCKQKDMFQKHVWEEHDDIEYSEKILHLHQLFLKFSCGLCEKEFKEKKSFHAHILKVHADSPKLVCRFCNKQFKWKRNLKVHVREVHSDAPRYKCKYCPKQYKWQTCVYRHVQDVHSDKSNLEFFCATCNKYFTRKDSLVRHTYTFHSTTEAKCEFCNKEFKHKSYLQKHVSLLHTESDKTFCKICNKDFRKNSHLLKHNTEVHQNGAKQCNICNKHVYYLHRHISQVHQSENSRKFACEICNKEFNNKDYLNKHVLRVHTGTLKEMNCQFCNKIFKYKRTLNIHISNVHLNIPKLSCDFCKKLFKHKSYLRKHVLKFHTDLPELVCKEEF